MACWRDVEPWVSRHPADGMRHHDDRQLTIEPGHAFAIPQGPGEVVLADDGDAVAPGVSAPDEAAPFGLALD